MPRKKKQHGIVSAIDLGTSTTLVAAVHPDGRIECLPDPDGNLSTPTAIGFENNDFATPLFGKPAENYRKIHPEWVSVINKRVRENEEIAILITSDGKSHSGGELESYFVKWRLQHVEELLGLPIVAVLIAVPACFDDVQRRASIRIVEDAGYKCIGTVNEPTAAILAYAHDKSGCFLVVDVGGGTSDVACIRVIDDQFTISAVSGQDDLGGKEFTARIIQAAFKEMKEKGVDADQSRNTRDMVLLEYACEEAKIALSSMQSTTMTWRWGSDLFDMVLTRARFEDITRDLREAILALVDEVMASAHLKPSDLTGVVFAGAGSRIPSIRRSLEERFGPEKMLKDIDVEKAVALGAARATTIKIRECIATGDVELAEEVSQYHLEAETIKLTDVIGQSLGVRAYSFKLGKPVLAEIIAQNTPLPASARRTFGLLASDHSAFASELNAKVTVLEGSADCPPEKARQLAEFPFEGLPPGRTQDRIEIAFSVDTSGIVHVKAIDLESNRELAGNANTTSCGRARHSL